MPFSGLVFRSYGMGKANPWAAEWWRLTAKQWFCPLIRVVQCLTLPNDELSHLWKSSNYLTLPHVCKCCGICVLVFFWGFFGWGLCWIFFLVSQYGQYFKDRWQIMLSIEYIWHLWCNFGAISAVPFLLFYSNVFYLKNILVIVKIL